MQTKLCGMCKQQKNIDNFSPEKATPTGLKWACKDCEKIRRKESYIKYRDRRIKATNKWKLENKDKHLKYVKEYRYKTRQNLLDIYGRLCACCGESNEEFLTLDHINGGGCKHRKKIGSLHTYTHAIRNIDQKIYRILCMNCNHATKLGKICPHQKLKN